MVHVRMAYGTPDARAAMSTPKRPSAVDHALTAWSLGRRAFAYEMGMWRSLYVWIFRRPLTRETGAAPFGYAGMVTPLLGVFIGVSAIEVPILHFLLPWQTVRVVGIILGAYGLLWMVGLLAALRVHPHVVAASGLRIRDGISHDVTIPW